MHEQPPEQTTRRSLDHVDAVAGVLLRGLMRDTGLSLVEVARMGGLPLLALAEWMTGRAQPTLGELIRVAEACGLELRLHLDANNGHRVLPPARKGQTPVRRSSPSVRE